VLTNSMHWTKSLRCPRCKTGGIEINPNPIEDALPQRGEAICTQCGARYPIGDSVLNMAKRDDLRHLTLAGLSNHLPLLPWSYENVWRPRALTQLSSENFPVEREIKLLNDWLAVQPRELIIDLGSSTDLYARGVAKSEPNGSAASLVAIDMATGMLKAGRTYARREGVKNIAHIRAPAQHLPFVDSSVDALVCGGSFNEFRSTDEALQEARRVCKPGGRLFAMSLLKATSLGGQLGQWNARLGGISFPTLDEFNAIVESTGWTRERQQVFGAVAFTLMRPRARK
jgi:SAM-dependent methyltransferase